MRTIDQLILTIDGADYEATYTALQRFACEAYKKGCTDAAEQCVHQGGARSSIECYKAITVLRDSKKPEDFL